MATTAQVTQSVLNITVALQNRVQQGQYGTDIYDMVGDLAAAVTYLAECLNANASALSSTTSPSSTTITTKYSGTQSTTAPVYTSP